MLLYHRILNIPWTDRVSNARVLQRMQKDKELMIIIKNENYNTWVTY